jgi:bifunctional enzyme CysN/CysC
MATPRTSDLAPVSPAAGLLRVMTCGSVDDGKSTLMGRLLYDSGQLTDEQSDVTDLALLMDGLLDERTQGITIDVAYRHLELEGRRLLLADTPGHEQYTRNMVTAASDADLALLLIDATQGITVQTRRHLFIVHLMCVPQLVLLINKMDAVDYNEKRFSEIHEKLQSILKELAFDGDHQAVPISALKGDNVLWRSSQMPWYQGTTLKDNFITATKRRDEGKPAFAVQAIRRDASGHRWYAGSAQNGQFTVGDSVQVARSRASTQISRIINADGELSSAGPSAAVCLQLHPEVDVSRGDVLIDPHQPLELSAQCEATLIWMDEHAGVAGRQYEIKLATQHTVATLTHIKHTLDLEHFTQQASATIGLNDIATCTLAMVQPLVFTPYTESRAMGSFILIDRQSQATVAAGLIRHGLRRAQHLHAQPLSISREERERLNGHPAKVLWFTGLSGAGKSTVANALQVALHTRGIHCYVLDGDNVRLGLNKDLGFTLADRVENIRRIAEVAALMLDAGLVVLTAFISPFRDERRMARELIGDSRFHEIHVATPLEVCEQRDVKGLYQKARQGALPNMTGIDSPYEAPESADLTLDTSKLSLDAAVDACLDQFFEGA